MAIAEMLHILLEKAKKDEGLRTALLATRRERYPMQEFCRKCQELGYPVYEMDLLEAGEEQYAAMRRSTNGGGENSPLLEGEDDYYALFMAELTAAAQGRP